MGSRNHDSERQHRHHGYVCPPLQTSLRSVLVFFSRGQCTEGSRLQCTECSRLQCTECSRFQCTECGGVPGCSVLIVVVFQVAVFLRPWKQLPSIPLNSWGSATRREAWSTALMQVKYNTDIKSYNRLTYHNISEPHRQLTHILFMSCFTHGEITEVMSW